MKVTLNNLHLNTLAAHLRPLPANRLPVFSEIEIANARAQARYLDSPSIRARFAGADKIFPPMQMTKRATIARTC